MKPLPPEKQHLQRLFDAYAETTGRELTLSPERQRTLREFDRRGLTPDDVRAVLTVLKSRVDRGVSGYSAASLDWKNTMTDVDRFEDRLAQVKEARARRRGNHPRPDVSTTRELPDGSTVTVLAPAAPSNDVPVVDHKAVAEQLKQFREKLGGS